MERRRWLAGTFLGAVLVRAAVFVSGLVDVYYTTGDSPEYRTLAESMIATGVFGQDGVPKMNRTPGYPAFLALVFATLGRSQLALTAAQVVLDALTCVMIVDLALRARFSRAATIVTAVASATCLYLVALSFQTMTETLFTAAIVASVWALPGDDVGDAPRTNRYWDAGLFAGLATLIRPNFAPAVAAFGAVLVLASWRARLDRAFAAVVVFGAAAALVVVPWMARNRVVFASEFEKPDHSNVTYFGYKTDVPVYRHWYTPEFHAFRASYEDPFVMESPYRAPSVARWVYPGEKQEVDDAFAALEREIKASDDAPISHETLAKFAAVAEKRHAAAARLAITPSITRVAMLWIVPRAGILYKDTNGGTLPRVATLALTAYDAIYAVLGILGVVLWKARAAGLRGIKLAILAYLVAETAFYAFWHGAPQSRYMVPLFPLLCLGLGEVASRVARRYPQRYSQRSDVP